MARRRSRGWMSAGFPLALALVGMVLLVGVGPVAATAQNGTRPHPAHIHSGSCDQLGDIVYPLMSVSMDGAINGTPEAGTPTMEMGQMMGAGSAVPVETSVTSVDASLDDLLGSPHAINVHQSKAKIDNYIACGDIGGRLMTGPAIAQGGRLVVGLRQRNDSGYSGVAVLESKGDQTEVMLYLAQGLSGGASAAAGTPAATTAVTATATAATDAANEQATVAIKNFAYHPDHIEIPAGGTITWTNQDGVPHTATAMNRDILQSGTISGGKSYSQTFDKPGTYEYFCEFHAQMHGTIVVK